MVRTGRYAQVLVLSEDRTVRGLVSNELVLRLAVRLPEAPVKILPLTRVAVLEDAFDLRAAAALLFDDEIEAVVHDGASPEGWAVYGRDELLREQEAAVLTAA